MHCNQQITIIFKIIHPGARIYGFSMHHHARKKGKAKLRLRLQLDCAKRQLHACMHTYIFSVACIFECIKDTIEMYM